MHIDSARRWLAPISPHFTQQFIARERRSAVFYKVSQQLKFLGRQCHRTALARHFRAADIDLKVAELIANRPAGLSRSRTPQQRINARQ